jgi:hexosaminidase
MTDLPLIPYPRNWQPAAGGPAGFDPAGVPVQARLVASLGFAPQHRPEEAYELELGPDGIELRALAEPGLRHARASLAALMAARRPGAAPDAPVRLPAGLIQDEPRFAWRGFMLDCARHFYPLADIKALIDRLAALKFNRFHWHLVDDQGWRLDIPELPRLTAVGAWRTEADGSRHGGFYTAAHARELVGYAAERGITVVPEIELPGHSSAAIAAYPEVSCSAQPCPVENRWGIFDKVYCVSSPTARRFLETVFAEVIRIFPGQWVHIGGDEVVRSAWEACPRCQAALREGRMSGVAELEADFFRHFIAWLAARGRTAIGWNELFEHAVPRSTVIQWWLHPEFARKALAAGNPLLVSNTEYSYLDYPYTAQDYWYRDFMKPLPTEKVYANPVVPEGCEALIDGILGGEACLWSEQVPPRLIGERLDGRLEAFAEVYWSFDQRPGWDSFSRRLASLSSPAGSRPSADGAGR